MGLKFTVQGEPIQKKDVLALSKDVRRCHDALHNKTGKGNDFVGWVDLPKEYDKGEFERLKKSAAKIRNDSSVLIVIGIGGSYLGTRTALDFIKSPFYNELKKDTPDIYFVGNNISSAYLNDILQILGDRDFSINVISKSGLQQNQPLHFEFLNRFWRKSMEKTRQQNVFTLPQTRQEVH